MDGWTVWCVFLLLSPVRSFLTVTAVYSFSPSLFVAACGGGGGGGGEGEAGQVGLCGGVVLLPTVLHGLSSILCLSLLRRQCLPACRSFLQGRQTGDRDKPTFSSNKLPCMPAAFYHHCPHYIYLLMTIQIPPPTSLPTTPFPPPASITPTPTSPTHRLDII